MNLLDLEKLGSIADKLDAELLQQVRLFTKNKYYPGKIKKNSFLKVIARADRLMAAQTQAQLRELLREDRH
jgi:hypothetical protein